MESEKSAEITRAGGEIAPAIKMSPLRGLEEFFFLIYQNVTPLGFRGIFLSDLSKCHPFGV